ncbi:heavy metal-binding protein HIP-like [Mercenaria mercenaria]|uniref:heavy metal-binding protein HIP-like n=1 Tax=Mercenaria mercenaria TaxID=6596 RepID=UPI00234E7C47|nr:heavy metal-binding protein HIP-like [Mercenaria mercenaria]
MLYCKFLFLFFLFLRVNSEEPHCSKYDFEEKVLEKMVRIEFQMERMKSEIEQSVKFVENKKTEVDATLKNIDQQLEDYSNNIEKLEALGTKISDTLTAKQQELEKNIDEKMAKIENKTLETLQAKIQELQTLKDEAVTPTITFKARLNSDSAAPAGQTFVFPTVLFNEGDAYSSRTGKFTATTSGTYLFTVVFCVIINKALTIGLMVDGSKYTVAAFYGDANYGCSTADTVAVLTAGQMVWVEALSGSSSGTIIDQDTSYRWNTFSGTLIHK